MLAQLNQYRTTIITITVLVSIVLLGAWYISALDEKKAERELADSDAAAVLSDSASSTPYTDFAGNPAQLDQHLGEVLVINSWASWSPFSGTELQLLADASAPYVDQGVVVIAMNRAENRRTAEAFLRTIRVDDRVRLIIDHDDRYYKDIGGYTMPETLFYSRGGDVVFHQRGPLTPAQATYYIEQALAAE